MRQFLFLIRKYTLLFLMTAVLLISRHCALAQVCLDPINVIYGLTNTGDLHPITVNTGIAGPQINPPYIGNPPGNPNGLGYSGLMGKFYYFKRSPGNAPQEFVSFDPLLNVVTVLSSNASIYSVYVGCITPDGTGYYCWDSRCNLYYYNILTDTWTYITNVLVDQAGNDVDSIIRANGSGDIAIDGNGNMLMLPSSTTKFAVYQMNAPLPTGPVASITVKEILPLAPPPAKFVGIALNSTGQILMSTAAPNNMLYRLENNLSLTFIANLSMDMADLASCNYPVNILPLSFKDFSATLKYSSVLLTWNIAEQDHVTGYTIEHSVNSVNWEQIGYIKESSVHPVKTFSFTDNNPAKGSNYYRIRLTTVNKEITYSAVRKIDMDATISFSVWPNPVQHTLRIQNNFQNNIVSKAFIFDQSGRKVREVKLSEAVNNIDMKTLVAGIYMVSVQLSNGEHAIYKILKQ